MVKKWWNMITENTDVVMAQRMVQEVSAVRATL